MGLAAGHRLRAGLEGALILAVGMGFGRFAYTAVYPYMVSEGVLTVEGGSLAASANYAGYLLGALLSVRMRPEAAHRFALVALAGTSVCLLLMAPLTSAAVIILLRGLAGAFSAVAFVAASVWLMKRRGQSHRAPLLYAGVGTGIAASAEFVVLAEGLGLTSAGMWVLLGVATAVIGLAVAPGLLGTRTVAAQVASAARNAATPVATAPLTVIYGLAGFGYIITATYLPLLVASALPDLNAAHAWAVFGLGAAPSCFFWHWVHARLGTPRALALNLVVQAAGVALPTVSQSAAGYLTSALLVGATFMGTVTIVMPAAQRVATGTNLVAVLTFVYGIGQIVGPLLAGALYARSQSFAGSLLVAAAALGVGAAATVLLHRGRLTSGGRGHRPTP